MPTLELILQNTSYFIFGMGVIAFLVSMITEFTKNLGFLAKIPTDWQVLVLAVTLTVVAAFVLFDVYAVIVKWYYVFAAVVIGLIVAMVAKEGWSYVRTAYKRFTDNKNTDE